MSTIATRKFATCSVTIAWVACAAAPARGQLLYWTDTYGTSIRRACLNGANAYDIYDTGTREPLGIAIDPQGRKMYWVDVPSNFGADAIRRANLDGTGVETIISPQYAILFAVAVDPAGGKVYFTDATYENVRRANLDGTNQEVVVSNQRFPTAVAVDGAGGRVYWLEGWSQNIFRANLDGSGIEMIVPHDSGYPPVAGIALHPAGGKIYWTALSPPRIRRANLDGSGVETIVSAGLTQPKAIAVDSVHQKVYWTDRGTAKILRANLNGTNVEEVVGTSAFPVAYGLALIEEPLDPVDCQPNGTIDGHDICNQTSLDCNHNDVPDECDLSGGASFDCNGNTTPDECDVAGGASTDCNYNVIPDECEGEPICSNQGHACEVTRFPPTPPSAYDYFGSSVSLVGEVAAVSAPSRSSPTAPDAGTVSVFRRMGRTWTQEAEVAAVDGASGDDFGRAVSLDGDTLLVGAPFDDDGTSSAGSAYLFRRQAGQWIQEQKFANPDPSPIDYFGRAVALEGDVAFIGAYADDERAENAGAVYVFRRTGGTWTQEVKLTPDDAGAGYYFGAALSIHSGRVVIGAPGAREAGLAIGATYVFRHNGSAWLQEAKLVAADGLVGTGFGWTVSVHGDWAIVGADADDSAAQNAGAAYLFHRSETGWAQHAKLTATDPSTSAYLGDDVAICGDVAVVSTRRGNPVQPSDGKCYWYRLYGGVWVQEGILADVRALNGYTVACSGESFIVGAAYAHVAGAQSAGQAYLFAIGGPDCDGDGDYDDCDADCNNNDTSDACDILYGVSADVLPLTGNGIPDECETDCNENAIPDIMDISTGLSEDCNDNLVPDECDIASGASVDCNANAIPDECEPDCNGNGQADSCDIVTGGSADCNANVVPDECEVDCNDNTIPDECDLTSGTSIDLNGNDVPDECDPQNDQCDAALPIYPGATTVNTTNATSDGPSIDYPCLVICDFSPCYLDDVWFEYTATCTGLATIQATTVNGNTPGMAAYEGCECPVDVHNAVGCSFPFISDVLQFPIVEGVCYLIQIGPMWGGGGETLLTFTIPDDCADAGNGDFDTDGDVDLDDWFRWARCVTGPGATVPVHPTCQALDLQGDVDVDLRDFASLALTPTIPPPHVFHVPGDFATIQSAIVAAHDHDRIVVAPGVYHETINFLGKSVTVTGTNPLDSTIVAATILDAGGVGSVVTFSGEETTASVLSGVTIRGGSAAAGGGIACHGASPTVENCTIISNSATNRGGGVDDCDGEVTNCTVSDNTANFGGGLSHCDGVIRQSIVSNNSASQWGGGFYFCAGIIRDSEITGNTVQVGGGGMAQCDGQILNTRISGNTSGNAGGGVYACNGLIANSVISGNTGGISGGGLAQCDGIILNCTITGNRCSYATLGGAMANCNGEVLNTILWNNELPYYYDSTPPRYSCTPPSGWNDPTVIEADPRFTTPGVFLPGEVWVEGDYHLSADSPCIDLGDPAARSTDGTTDLDGRNRWLCGRADIGAFEFGTGDYDCDRAVDLADYAAWPSCFTGPLGGIHIAACEPFDARFDAHIDLRDFAAFQLLAGPP